MLRAYIDGLSQSINNKSTLSITITDLKGNLEYQNYELLDSKRSSTEIEMMAFNKMMDWLLENKINKIIVYTDSRYVYTNWRKNKAYSLNKSKFDRFVVRLIGNLNNVVNLAFA
ncbi:reverse transcriptase-like protein [Brevibacillus porteri]|uniref:reverse transcriptase-like protein n=1 Tax=Brevibacillus porteri TaxID=2126350 RepID=UPI003633662B